MALSMAYDTTVQQVLVLMETLRGNSTSLVEIMYLYSRTKQTCLIE